jgi:ubiquinol-cytochrome c reductase cytochrome c subunit
VSLSGQTRGTDRRRVAPGLRHLIALCLLVLAASALAVPALAAAASPAPLQTPPAGVEPPAGSGTFTPAATPQPAPTSTSPPGSGERLYAENCAGCHGARGEGFVGPPLAAAGFASLVGPMVVEGGIAMPGFAGVLSDEEIAAISDHVADELAAPESREAEVMPGGDLFRLYCSGCHSSTGSGGAMPNLNNAPDIRQYPPAEALAAMILGRGNMPSFADNTFDVRQQTSVALYVQVIHDPPSPGGAGIGFLGPVPEGAVGGVLLFLLILIAVWLAGPARKAVP